MGLGSRLRPAAFCFCRQKLTGEQARQHTSLSGCWLWQYLGCIWFRGDYVCIAGALRELCVAWVRGHEVDFREAQNVYAAAGGHEGHSWHCGASGIC
jgi:hypothetical protein